MSGFLHFRIVPEYKDQWVQPTSLLTGSTPISWIIPSDLTLLGMSRQKASERIHNLLKAPCINEELKEALVRRRNYTQSWFI
jgi:hypothetical protein